MSIFTRLFGGGGRPEDVHREAELAIEEALASADSKKAMKILRPFTRPPLEALGDFGGPMHPGLRAAVLAACNAHDRAQGQREIEEAELPPLEVFTDPGADAAGAVLAAARSEPAPVLFVRHPSRWKDNRMTVCALEMWRRFGVDVRLAAAYLGEDFLMIRGPLYARLAEQYPEIFEQEADCDAIAGILGEMPEFEDADHVVLLCGYEVYRYRA